MRCIELQKVRVYFGGSQIVNGNNAKAGSDIRALVQRTQNISTYSTKTINCYVNHNAPFDAHSM